MNIPTDIRLTPENRRLLEERWRLRDQVRLNPELALFRRCSVRLLLVTDRLSFSPSDDFGLGTFVKILLDAPIWGRVHITLANIGAFNIDHVDPSLTTEARIVNRIPNFRFDNTAHFDPSKFDAIFLFGISSGYSSALRSGGTLENSEIEILNAFQDGGGGVFATGDHGRLGFALCSKVARARDMRLWDSTPSADPNVDVVSMGGPRRNDTNVSGTNSFSDQSDDVPQTITPRMYSRRSGLFRYHYPHPLLCGPNGVIRVMPDHPHEGECKTPASTGLTIKVDGADKPEYPPAVGGGTPPTPEIIAWNHVAAGRTSGGKDPTVAQTFPSICAYDGHRAGIGRVVTDSTWHHFVNVNLIGIDGAITPPYDEGFLASAAGQAAFEEIKAYFRNLMVWLSRSGTIKCLRSSILINLVNRERVLEAVLTAQSVRLAELSPRTLALIGAHARDVLGRYAGRCQSLELIIDLFEIEWRPWIDPWLPRLKEEIDPEPWNGLPLTDLGPLLDVALGGALVEVSRHIETMDPKRLVGASADSLLKVASKGASEALAIARKDVDRSLRELQGFAPLRRPN